MRSWLAAVTLLQVLVAAPALGQPTFGPPLPGPLPWREPKRLAEAPPAPAPRLRTADEGPAAPPLLLADARRRRLPPVAGHGLVDPPVGDFGQCVSEAERRAAAPSERFRAFRRNAVPIPPLLFLSQDRTFVEALLLYWSSTNVEERTKLRMLLPVFVWSCTPKSRTLVTPLFAHRDDAEGRAGFVGPYFYRRDRHAQSDVLFPLFSRVVDREHGTITALSFYHHRNPRGSHGGVVPLAFWGSGRDGSHYALVPPLFFHVGDRDQSTTVVPPFYYRSHRRSRDFDVGLAPLYFGARHGGAYQDVVPPLLFARWGDRRETNVWWLTSFFHRRGASWSFNLAPLYFAGRTGDRYHQVVLPPLFAHWGDRRRARTMVLNLYVRVDRRSDDWFFFLIPAAFGFRAGRTVAVISPAVSHVSTPTSTTTIAPPFYLYRDTRRVHWGLFPLAFHGHHRDRLDGTASYTHVPPLLFFDVRDRRGATTWALNSYYSRNYRPDGSVDPRDWDAGVIPLWFQGRALDRRYLVVPPLLLFDRENEATGERTTVFPLGYRVRDRRSSSFGLVPFFFQHASGPEHFWFAPALWSAHWGDGITETTVVGPWFRRRTASGLHHGVFPLFFRGHTDTSRYTVLPFLPFWYQRDLQRTLLIVGPLYLSRTTAGFDFGLAPLVFTGHTGPRHYTVVPPAMLYDWGDAAAGTRTTLFPVGYRHRHPGGWHFGLVPLVFASAHGPAHRTVIPPLLTCHWGDGETERTIAAGLVYSFRAPASRHHGLFPIYLAGERDLGHPEGPASYRLIAPPLYIHRWSPSSETTVFLQTWSHRGRNGEWHGGSIPFYLGGRVPASGGYYDLLLPPLFVRWGGDRGRHAFLLAGPMYYRRLGEQRELGLFPVYFGGRHLGDGTHRYDYVLPPLFMRWKNRHERKLVVGPFYDRVTATTRDTMLPPFYFGGHDRARGTYHDVVAPFFARWGDPAGRTTVVLSGFYRRGYDGYSLGLAPIFFHGRGTDGRHHTHLAPLFWHWGTRDRETTVVLSGFYRRGRDGYDLGLAPLFFHGRSTDGRHYTHVVPLVWRWGSRHEAGTVVFPLGFGYRHRDRYARAVTPIFYQWGDRRSRKSLLFPLAYLEREARGHLFLSPLVVSHVDAVEHKQRLVVFPLLWRFASRDSQATVAFPLWWDFSSRRPASRLSILFPLGFRYDKRDETMTVFLNVATTRGKGRFAGAWSFHFVPLLELASFNPEHFKWQVLLGLLGRERQGRLARWRIAYFWTDPS
jgi:hypothetical protein